jgi:hypothetical protein
LHAKGNNYQNEDTTYRMEENLCQIFIKGSISRIYKGLRKLKLITKGTNNPINKWANEFKKYK